MKQLPDELDRASRRTLKRLEEEAENMKEWCGRLGVDHCDAAAVYLDAFDNGLLRGRLGRAMRAASVYVAARYAEHPITALEVSRVTNIPGKRLHAYIAMWGDELPVQDVAVYAEAGAQKLGIRTDMAPYLRGIKDSLGPAMQTAIALYRAAHQTHSMEQVAEAAGVEYRSLQHYVLVGGALKPKACVQ